jgi:hypothetical protein
MGQRRGTRPRGGGAPRAPPPPRPRYQPADLHAVEAVRIAFGALAPGSGSPAHDDRCDAECAMVEVENVRVEAEGLQQGRIHEADFVSRGCRTNPHWSNDNGTGLPRHIGQIVLDHHQFNGAGRGQREAARECSPDGRGAI